MCLAKRLTDDISTAQNAIPSRKGVEVWLEEGMMRMRLLAGLLLSLMVVAPTVSHGQGSPSEALPLFSIRDGESLPLRSVTSVTPACASAFISVEGIHVLEGPPGLSLTFEPGKVRTAQCKNELDGGIVFAAAKNVTEKWDAPLTFRVRMVTQYGPTQLTYRIRILLFPSDISRKL